METKTQKQPRQPSHPIYANEGLSPKKTALIIVTVIGCIAILWPKVFYPMMFGSTPPKSNTMKEPQRGPGGCCDVVLDRDTFYNSTLTEFGPQPFRKDILNIYTGEILSLRQERPAHLHPESIYQAMRERGRAIPATQTVPILERKGSPSNPPPRYVEGRPGPIPGMRPPMGAGALHQPQQKGNSMGFIMPIYTIGIIVFFGYTIMKIVFKKPIPNAPYGPAPTDPNFRKEVFGLESRHVEELNGSPLGTATFANNSNNASIPLTTTNNTNNVLPAANNHHYIHGPYPYDPRKTELYNASLSAANAASNISTSLKQHQQQFQQRQQEQQQQQQQLLQQHPSTTVIENITASHELEHDLSQSADFNSPEVAISQAMSKVLEKDAEQLLEIESLRKKLEDTERQMAKIIAEMNRDKQGVKNSDENSTSNNVENISNGHTTKEHKSEDLKSSEPVSTKANAEEQHRRKVEHTTEAQTRKRRDGSGDRSVAVLGMEVTASCEGGQKWSGRPPTPDFFFHNEHSKDNEDDEKMPEPQSIYLEGALAHESKILVADAETKREEVYDAEFNGSEEEPAVILSSKMTLSLINLDTSLDKSDEDDELIKCITKKKIVESPLADDIEIIGHVSDENDE